MKKEIQKFEVSIKGFILKDEKLLMLEEAGKGLWELPGGRIDVGDELVLQEQMLLREIREELGPSFKVKIGPTISSWVRSRNKDFVFLVGKLCWYEKGEVALISEHSSFAWVDHISWKKLNLAPGYIKILEEFWQLGHDLKKSDT